jgi:hypothetical protein
MPSQRQLIVEPVPPADKPLGSRNDANLKRIFSASPLPGYLNELSDESIVKFYQKDVLDGKVSDGFGFPMFDTNYMKENGAPDLSKVDTGGGGKPATPYVPNLNSPGPGITTANAVPAYEGSIPDGAPEFGSGLGGTLSPSTTSTEIQKQTLGSFGLGLQMGASYPGSDGTS